MSELLIDEEGIPRLVQAAWVNESRYGNTFFVRLFNGECLKRIHGSRLSQILRIPRSVVDEAEEDEELLWVLLSESRFTDYLMKEFFSPQEG